MAKQTISVLISTRNKPKNLSLCLLSLCQQTVKPFEIIIIDNGPSLETKNITDQYTDQLPIRYFIERKKGLPFGRNLSIKQAKGTLCAFIDDDCIASPAWLESILKHFSTHPSQGVIGRTVNANPTNVPSCVEDVYYYRWLLQCVPSIKKASLLQSGACIDFRNAVFLSSFIKQFQFNTRLLVSCEDVEMGIRLFKVSQNIYFNPTINVSHNNSHSYINLFKRNFRSGYGTQQLLDAHLVRSHDVRHPYDNRKWKNYINHISLNMQTYNKIIFILDICIFPFWSGVGKCTFILKKLAATF
jgi:glycosyltransferase involved in cell wall biosynthesis